MTRHKTAERYHSPIRNRPTNTKITSLVTHYVDASSVAANRHTYLRYLIYTEYLAAS
jgi:hypothetical protein